MAFVAVQLGFRSDGLFRRKKNQVTNPVKLLSVYELRIQLLSGITFPMSDCTSFVKLDRNHCYVHENALSTALYTAHAAATNGGRSSRKQESCTSVDDVDNEDEKDE